ncbi:MAG: DUF1833 family protein [Thermodesulfobacteriota bacterium]
MLTLSSTAIAEKNKLAAGSLFLLALEVTIPGASETIRVVADADDMTWRGQTWVAWPFQIEELTETSKSEVPRVSVRISNVSRAIEAYLQAYDTWCKNYGFSPIEASIYVVNSLNLASDDPEVVHDFELRQPLTDSVWATFVLSAGNPWDMRVPQGRILKNHCRYRFKDSRCGYTGPAAVCDHTLTACRNNNNSTRFGGFPGAGQGGLYIAEGA